jgi:hypothetical protein
LYILVGFLTGEYGLAQNHSNLSIRWDTPKAIKFSSKNCSLTPIPGIWDWREEPRVYFKVLAFVGQEFLEFGV